MPIAFERSICRDLRETISREWLVTNGRGGYAAGTIAGVLTRMQHGLLVASLPDATTPQLLLAKIDEEIVFDERTYYLGTNEYQDGTLNPSGFVHLETFHLVEGFPIFTYRLGGIDGILLEKRIWMPRGRNTTFIQYRVLRRAGIAQTSPGSETLAYGSSSWNSNRESGNKAFGRYSSYAQQRALTLTLLPFSAYRPYDQPQHGNLNWHFQVLRGKEIPPGDFPLPCGVAACVIRAWEDAPAYSIVAVGHQDSSATFIPTNVWYWHFLRRHDQAAGRDAIDDLYLPGVIRAKLWPSEDSTLTIIVSAEELSSASQILHPSQYDLSFEHSVEEQRDVLRHQHYLGAEDAASYYDHMLPLPARSLSGDASPIEEEEFLRLLVQAADRFLIRRKRIPTDTVPVEERGPFFFTEPEYIPAVLADYYSLADSTRDTLIALPGLTLPTRRFDVARSVLLNLARYFQQGMLPDHLPLMGQALDERDYSSADTTLWYFYALDHYLQTTHDYELLAELYVRLASSIDWYLRGTFNAIAVDTADGLLSAYQVSRAQTWMNATIDEVPVTQRAGKAVEVNALWYNTLSLMQEWSQRRQEQGQASAGADYYAELSKRCKASFNQRFWHKSAGYLYDSVDGPQGEDAALRPNQLLAVALRYQVLDREHWQEVFNVVTQHLVTPYGLRTLAAHEAGYTGRPGANQKEQLRALHQGSSWPWLIGPYVDALLNISHAFAPPGQSENKSQMQAGWWHKSLKMIELLRTCLYEGILGMVGGVYDGNSPHHNHIGYKVTSVTAVGEILRVYNLLAQNTTHYTDVLLAVQGSINGRSSYGEDIFHETDKPSA